MGRGRDRVAVVADVLAQRVRKVVRAGEAVAADGRGRDRVSPSRTSGRLFDELFTTVGAFRASLQEIEQKPAPDLLKSAVREVEETEAKLRLRRDDSKRTL